MSLLDSICDPKDLKNLNKKQLDQLSCEIRDTIIETVSKNGGHLASNLGIVELTIALHKVFDSPDDRIIFDVGHQCYPHKILTGRIDRFESLRKKDGISGYPNPDESPHDQFHTGHASTAISLAAGVITARDLNHESHKVIAVVGDGSLTGGESFEALNYLGHLNSNVIVILNDNQMSISPSVGAISLLTSKLRAAIAYRRLSYNLGKVLGRMGAFGEWVIGVGFRFKATLKRFLMADQYFEQLGFRYLGPVDGHDIGLLTAFLNRVKVLKGPILLHILTTKGKGCSYAEEHPVRFHGTPPFESSNGNSKPSGNSFSWALGEILVKTFEHEPKAVAITAAMLEGTGLSNLATKFPKRVFDVGIAEEHAVTMASSLARSGFRPIVAIYSTFLQRAYDQIIHDVSLMKLPVVFAVDRAGLVPDDGPTHQGIFDLAYLSTVPGLTIMAPSTLKEFEQMMFLALSLDGPSAIRYPKDSIPNDDTEWIKYGKASIEKKGSDALIAYIGALRMQTQGAVKILEEIGISCSVLNIRFAYPLDWETIECESSGKKLIITVEDGISTIGEKIKAKLGDRVRCLAVPNEFPPIGTRLELLKLYKLDSEGIASLVLEYLKPQ